MADKGAMIELQVNPSRIVQLAPLHQQTPLTEPGREAFIVAPTSGEFGAIAADLQQRLAVLTGLEPCIVDQEDSWNPEGLAAPLV